MSSALAHSPAEVLRKFLEDGDYPIGVFVSNEPSAPDDTVTIFDTAGIDDGRVMIDGELQAHYGVQLRIRSFDHPTGWLRSQNLRTLLSESLNQAIVTFSDGSQFILWCSSHIGTVLALGTESPTSKRYLFTLNCTLSISQIAAVNVPQVVQSSSWQTIDS